WLMTMRRFVRYLASEGHIPDGWEDALPKRVNWKRASLPRFLSQEEKQMLWKARRRNTHRHIRDRAMLLVFTRLGLRTEEVARLALKIGSAAKYAFAPRKRGGSECFRCRKMLTMA